jgi:hypothetical protein
MPLSHLVILFEFFQDYSHFFFEAPPNIPAIFTLFRDYKGGFTHSMPFPCHAVLLRV